MRTTPSRYPVSTQAGANTVHGFINGLSLPGTSGGTNWDRGLAQVAAGHRASMSPSSSPTATPPFTANPHRGPAGRRNSARSRTASSPRTPSRPRTPGSSPSASAPASVGLRLNLRSISGTTLNTDYFQTTDYAQAGNALRALALGACQLRSRWSNRSCRRRGTIARALPAGGWTFTPPRRRPESSLAPGPLTDGAAPAPSTSASHSLVADQRRRHRHRDTAIRIHARPTGRVSTPHAATFTPAQRSPSPTSAGRLHGRRVQHLSGQLPRLQPRPDPSRPTASEQALGHQRQTYADGTSPPSSLPADPQQRHLADRPGRLRLPGRATAHDRRDGNDPATVVHHHQSHGDTRQRFAAPTVRSHSARRPSTPD